MKLRIRSLTSDEVFDTETDTRPTGRGPFGWGAVTLVAGPPGSGKSTYVRQHMKRGDLVVDLAEIFRAISLIEDRDIPKPLLPFGWRVKEAIICQLQTWHNVEQAWIIECAAKRLDRQTYRSLFDAHVVVLEVPEDRCLNRIYANPLRAPNQIDWFSIVRKWWRDYEPSHMDEKIKEISEFDQFRQSFSSNAWRKGEKSEQ